MAWKMVENYNLGYNVQTKQFYFYYQLEGEDAIHQISPSAEDFLGLSDMFRHEKAISFSMDGQYFITGSEPDKIERTGPL